MFVYGFKEGEDDAFLKKLATFPLETRGILKSAINVDAGGERREGQPSPDCRPLSPAAHRHAKFAWVNPDGGPPGARRIFPRTALLRRSSCRGSFRC